MEEVEIVTDSVCENFVRSDTFDGKSYSLRLPWKRDPEILPDNYSLSIMRLNSLYRRLLKNPRSIKTIRTKLSENKRTKES